MKYLVCLLILISNSCFADEAFLGYGVGVFNDANYFLGQTKYIDIGYREFMWDGIYFQNKLGYIGEGSPDSTRKSGAWGSSGLGLEMDLNPVEIRSGGALAFITSPDSQLGGYFPQFNENLSVGLRDKKGDGVSLDYNHISSANLVTPNLGRDFVLLELSQKW